MNIPYGYKPKRYQEGCRLKAGQLTPFVERMQIKQGVALKGRNTTGPPCSVGRLIPTLPAAGAPTVHPPGGRPARMPAALQTTTDDDDDRR